MLIADVRMRSKNPEAEPLFRHEFRILRDKMKRTSGDAMGDKLVTAAFHRLGFAPCVERASRCRRPRYSAERISLDCLR